MGHIKENESPSSGTVGLSLWKTWAAARREQAERTDEIEASDIAQVQDLCGWAPEEGGSFAAMRCATIRARRLAYARVDLLDQSSFDSLFNDPLAPHWHWYMVAVKHVRQLKLLEGATPSGT